MSDTVKTEKKETVPSPNTTFIIFGILMIVGSGFLDVGMQPVVRYVGMCAVLAGLVVWSIRTIVS